MFFHPNHAEIVHVACKQEGRQVEALRDPIRESPVQLTADSLSRDSTGFRILHVSRHLARSLSSSGGITRCMRGIRKKRHQQHNFFGSFQMARCDTHSCSGANSLWSPFLVRLQDHQTLDQALIRRYSKPLTCFNSHRLTFQEHAEEASFQVQGVHSSEILSVPACHCWRNAESCRKSLATPSTKP